MVFAEATTNVTITALVWGLVALISPALALTRWIQEKTTKHRSRDEIQRSRELFEFIRHYPKMSATAGSSRSAVLGRARAELAHSITNIDNLLEKAEIKAAPPNELAWPRRLLLLYAPRSWGAMALHTLYYLFATVSILAISALGNDDETDTFQWREFVTHFHNPLFWIGLSYWIIQLWLLWYAATAKDRWDGTLPIRADRKVFLMQAPASVRELTARMLLVWSVFDLAVSEISRGPATVALKAYPVFAAVLNALPKPPLWEHVVGGLAAISCPLLAYLWTRAEYKGRGKKLWIAFPHNLRFLYPISRRQDVLAEFFFVLFAMYCILLSFRLHELLSIVVPVVPSDDQGAFFMGVIWSPLVELILAGIIPIYGAYRVGLISYLTDYELQPLTANKIEAQTTNNDIHNTP